MEMGSSIVKTGRWLGGTLLDQLYPPVCLSCDAPVATADALCSQCFRSLRSITAPLCPVLGLPFEASLGPDARSAEAIADPPPFERARSAVVYNDVARALVGKLKYGDRPELARFCGRLMAQAGHELWGPDAVLVPVPLHRVRLFSRRYNQSTELARALGRLTGLPVDPAQCRRRLCGASRQPSSAQRPPRGAGRRRHHDRCDDQGGHPCAHQGWRRARGCGELCPCRNRIRRLTHG